MLTDGTDIADPGPHLPAERKTTAQQVALAVALGLPLLALISAVPVVWLEGIGWHDVVIAAAMYAFTGLGVTLGFHRAMAHRAFRPARWLKVLLAVAGSMSVQGNAAQWVADHRKHHRFTDRDGDPHSPWGYGSGAAARTRGLLHAHVGWLFDVEQTSLRRYAPDVLADPDLAAVTRAFPALVVVSLLLPALVGGLWGGSWGAALTAVFWASLVRIALLHHVTFAINSVCHVTGRQPFTTRDQSRNVWWLAIPSFGEAWHNFHHAQPAAARHGVGRGQLDISARLIWAFEKLRWVTHVRWPDPAGHDGHDGRGAGEARVAAPTG